MPLHGRLWRWSPGELDRAVALLLLMGDGTSVTFTTADLARVAEAISQRAWHAQGLRLKLLTTGRMVVADDSDRRKYLYRLQGTDGKQAQRAAPAAD